MAQVLYLPMDANFNDASSDASEVHTPTYTADIDTIIKYAGAGSGKWIRASNKYVSFPDSVDWNFGSKDFKVRMWVNFASLPTGTGQYCIFDQRGAGYFYCWLSNVSSILTLQVYISGVFGLKTVAWTPTIGVWYDLRIERVGNHVGVYIDDVEKMHDESPGTMADITGDLSIGKLAGYTGYSFDGNLDEIEITVDTGTTYDISATDSLQLSDLLLRKDNRFYPDDSISLSDLLLRKDNRFYPDDSISLSDSFGKTMYVNLPPEFSPLYYWNPATSLWEVVEKPY